MKILAPAIVDPAAHRGGTGTVVRALAGMLARPPVAAQLHFVAPAPSRVPHRMRQAASLARAALSPLPAKAHFVRRRALRCEVVRRLREETWDLLWVVGSDLLWLLDELPARPPTMLLALNSEHALYRSQIEALGESLGLPAPLRRALLRDCAKLRRLEERSLAAVDAALCVSASDAEWIRQQQPGLPVLHVPPVFDGRRASPARASSRAPGLHLGLLANLEWWPNRAGLAWFLEEVFPSLPDDVRLHLFGHRSETAARGVAGVERHGFVPCLDEVWRRCDLMICPIASGAGVSIKLAEALYHRVPVLARPFATRGLGLDADPDPAVVTLEGAAEWIEFLGSSRARELAARRVAPGLAERFSADRHAPALHDFVAEAAATAEIPEARRARPVTGGTGQAARGMQP